MMCVCVCLCVTGRDRHQQCYKETHYQTKNLFWEIFSAISPMEVNLHYKSEPYSVEDTVTHMCSLGAGKPASPVFEQPVCCLKGQT